MDLNPCERVIVMMVEGQLKTAEYQSEELERACCKIIQTKEKYKITKQKEK